MSGGVKVWIEASRPKTLAAAIVPIVIGSAEAYRVGSFEWFPVLICLAFALLVQIGTNMANDYYDFLKGADTEERVGPERMVSSGLIVPKQMLVVTIAIFALAFLVGLNLVAYRGWEMLVVGVISILFGFAYTGGPYPLAYHGLGDVFVVLFFGLVATGGTFYVLTGQLVAEPLLIGGSVGLLANNILVINNYRDQETDEQANKRTLIVRWGRSFGILQYGAQLLGAATLLVIYVGRTQNFLALIPLVLLPIGLSIWSRLPRSEGSDLNALLGQSARFLLLYGLALGAVLVASVSI